MNVPGIARATVVVIALAVAGVPVARRLCGLACDAVPAPTEAASGTTAPHCPAHPLPPEPRTPDDRANPCGHGHGGDGALRTASAGFARSGAHTSETPAPEVPLASGPSVPTRCGWSGGFDRRLVSRPPAADRPVLRL